MGCQSPLAEQDGSEAARTSRLHNDGARSFQPSNCQESRVAEQQNQFELAFDVWFWPTNESPDSAILFRGRLRASGGY